MHFRTQLSLAVLALLSITVTGAPLGPIVRVQAHGKGVRYQATEHVGAHITDQELRDKNKAFYHKAVAEHAKHGGESTKPGMAASHLHGGTIYHSTTANGGQRPKEEREGKAKPKEHEKDPGKAHTYTHAEEAHSRAKGTECKHWNNGRCAEGGTASMVEKAHPGASMHGDRISSYGTAVKPGGHQKVEGHHPACHRDGVERMGCTDVMHHAGVKDVNCPHCTAKPVQRPPLKKSHTV